MEPNDEGHEELAEVSAEGLERALAHRARGGALVLHTRQRRLRRLLWVLAVLAVYVTGTAAVVQRYRSAPPADDPRVVVWRDGFYRNGEKFLVKAVGWDPARPGELPWSRDVSTELVDEDFARIRAAGFNTIRTWEALSWEELAAAERHDLAVLQGIWLAPDGAFGDAGFRDQALQKVRDVVGYSRDSRAVVGYLVLNEPAADHVLSQGVDETRSFLRLVREEVQRLDPDALVAFSSWPGLEFLTEPRLDFAGANLYPFRPTALLHALGYEGMVRVWKRLQAADRPLLVTELGVSVSPGRPGPEAPGGATEEEQARTLVEMADQVHAAGGAGFAVFGWIDGWWKDRGPHQPGDERRHDPNDAEEWFGLVAMDEAGDRIGRERPALAAMRDWFRAVVTLPENGPVEGWAVPLEVHSEAHDDLQVVVSVNGMPSVAVPLTRQGPWHRGWIGLAVDRRGAQTLDVTIHEADGALIRAVQRVVFPPGQQPSLAMELSGEGGQRTVDLVATGGDGQPLVDADVRVALSEATGRRSFVRLLRTDEGGRVGVTFDAPEPRTVGLLVAALWDPPGPTPSAIQTALVEAP